MTARDLFWVVCVCVCGNSLFSPNEFARSARGRDKTRRREREREREREPASPTALFRFEKRALATEPSRTPEERARFEYEELVRLEAARNAGTRADDRVQRDKAEKKKKKETKEDPDAATTEDVDDPWKRDPKDPWYGVTKPHQADKAGGDEGGDDGEEEEGDGDEEMEEEGEEAGVEGDGGDEGMEAFAAAEAEAAELESDGESDGDSEQEEADEGVLVEQVSRTVPFVFAECPRDAAELDALIKQYATSSPPREYRGYSELGKKRVGESFQTQRRSTLELERASRPSHQNPLSLSLSPSLPNYTVWKLLEQPFDTLPRVVLEKENVRRRGGRGGDRGAAADVSLAASRQGEHRALRAARARRARPTRAPR